MTTSWSPLLASLKKTLTAGLPSANGSNPTPTVATKTILKSSTGTKMVTPSVVVLLPGGFVLLSKVPCPFGGIVSYC